MYEENFGKNSKFCGKSLSCIRYIKSQDMVTEQNERYISPDCEVVEIMPEGIIAESGINSDE